MKTIFHLITLSFVLSLNLSQTWAMDKLTSEPQKTYQDIEQTLGRVPTFMKEFPADAIPGAWLDFKNIQLNSQTKLSGKDKELIGLAVAAQIPCRYCTYFHTQAAKLNKASAQELKEAIAMAGSVRRWSTILHGSQTDFDQFKSEVDRSFNFVNKNKNKQAMEAVSVKPAPEIMTAEDAYKDIEMHMGFVPTFFKSYPKEGIAGAWRAMKALDMSSTTALSGKTKDLIGIAVAAQMPCAYCVYYHTKSAMLNGAVQEEINEAIAMSGITRNWSTVLNGIYTDDKKFENEANQIIKFVKSKSTQEVSLR